MNQSISGMIAESLKKLKQPLVFQGFKENNLVVYFGNSDLLLKTTDLVCFCTAFQSEYAARVLAVGRALIGIKREAKAKHLKWVPFFKRAIAAPGFDIRKANKFMKAALAADAMCPAPDLSRISNYTQLAAALGIAPQPKPVSRYKRTKYKNIGLAAKAFGICRAQLFKVLEGTAQDSGDYRQRYHREFNRRYIRRAS